MYIHIKQIIYIYIFLVCAQAYPTLCDTMDCSLPGCPWNFPGKNTGVSCHFLLLRDLPNPGIKPASLALKADSLPLSHWEARICSQISSSDGKESACQCRRPRFNPWVKKISWRREWQPTPVFLSGKFHGQRSLAGCSPLGHKE